MVAERETKTLKCVEEEKQRWWQVGEDKVERGIRRSGQVSKKSPSGDPAGGPEN